jgi:hypothetical protein
MIENENSDILTKLNFLTLKIDKIENFIINIDNKINNLNEFKKEEKTTADISLATTVRAESVDNLSKFFINDIQKKNLDKINLIQDNLFDLKHTIDKNLTEHKYTSKIMNDIFQSTENITNLINKLIEINNKEGVKSNILNKSTLKRPTSLLRIK